MYNGNSINGVIDFIERINVNTFKPSEYWTPKRTKWHFPWVSFT